MRLYYPFWFRLGRLRGWVYYCCPRGLKLLQSGAAGPVIGDLYTELHQLIKELKIDILGIDPFVKAHGVEENDNNLIDQVCIMLAQLGDDFDCAVDLVSHAPEGIGGAGRC